jgi:ADP-ribosylation factor-like protein 6
MNFTMFDMSGQGRYRNLWEHYYADAEAVIFVIDSTDAVRLCVVRDELDNLLQHKDLASRLTVPILFFANKMDVAKAMAVGEISEALELHKLTDRPFTIVASNGLTGAGLDEGIKWLSGKLK